jgi:FkbM family methyltransferase
MATVAMSVRRLMRRLLPPPVALAVRKEWLARRVASERGYREGDIELLPRFVGPTDVCWDIGASSGTYTVALSRLASKVVAFEPVPHSFEILEKVRTRARLTNVSTERLAISEGSGTARMDVPVDGFYGGFYLAALADHGSFEVPTASIDDLVARGYAEPDFIKCDVEGAERRVIDGARALIERRHPIWLLETFEDDIIPLAHSLGYRTYVNIGGGKVERVGARTRDRNYWLLHDRVADALAGG